MIEKIVIKERGPTPRGFKKAYNAASKTSWSETGTYFHVTYRPKRFTVAHGREAGYRKRQGEDIPYGTRAFWRSYIGRKIKKTGTRDPLVWTGNTRRKAAIASIAATSKGAKVRYAGLNVLNFHPDLIAEFRKILPREARQMGRIYDRGLNRGLRSNADQSTREV